MVSTNNCDSFVNFAISGAGIGGANGLYNGLKDTKAAQLTGAVRRTQYVSPIYYKYVHIMCLFNCWKFLTISSSLCFCWWGIWM